MQKSSHTDFYKKASSVANSYGFLPFEEALKRYGSAKKKACPKLDAQTKKIDSLDGELTGTLSVCIEKNIVNTQNPILIHSNSIRGGKTKPYMNFGLHVIGTKESIAEALILKAATQILEEAGIDNASFRLNSIGDKDSSQKFSKELTSYFRKHINEIPPQSREAMKKDVFLALETLRGKEHELVHALPKPMEYLSTDARRHLREVLEYVETAGIPYELDDSLIRHRDCYSQTLFEFETEDGSVHARGGRYDELSRRFFNTDVPAVGIVFKVSCPNKVTITQPRVAKRPKIFFIHLGFEAKLKSLFVIEKLRRARVPYYHALGGKQFSEQLAYADELSAPLIIIMGQREALEDTVIVRNRETRAQDVVSIEGLPEYLRTVNA